MKGKIRFLAIVLCGLLLSGPVPAKEPVQAKLEQQAVPEGLALPDSRTLQGDDVNAVLGEETAPWLSVANGFHPAFEAIFA
jgi:hypothetical protein